MCAVRRVPPRARRERGVLLVVALTAATMIVEIIAGHLTGSMALLADGWHMATHVGALGLASLAYAMSRRYARHRAFVFGTGKVRALAGFTSAIALGLVALFMAVESIGRLFSPESVDFVRSLPVAVVGLVVNLVSVLVLHSHDDRDDHDDDHHHHEHDHNHRAAVVHVVADTFTSAVAILALLAGRYLGWAWLDPVSGALAGIVILRWSADLIRHSAVELLDIAPSSTLEGEVRAALEAVGDARVRDLHVWGLGGPAKSCIATVVSATPRETNVYKAALERFELAHVTIEVQRVAAIHATGRADSSEQ